MPAHDHEHFEITLVLCGGGLHCTPSYTAPLAKGDVILASPGQVHAFREIDGLHKIACVFLPECLVHEAGSLCNEPGVLDLFFSPEAPGDTPRSWIPQHKLSEEDFQACFYELRGMVAEQNRQSASMAFMKHSLVKMMLIIGRSFERAGVRSTGPALRPGIVKALGLIEAMAASAERFDMGALAHRCGYSKDHFSHLFIQATGAPPRTYFQQRRIQHACWLLLYTNHSITDIAHSLGFSDTPHFVRVFHKLRGLAPGKYRKRYANGDPEEPPRDRKAG